MVEYSASAIKVRRHRPEPAFGSDDTPQSMSRDPLSATLRSAMIAPESDSVLMRGQLPASCNLLFLESDLLANDLAEFLIGLHRFQTAVELIVV
jgi:hypothetical protein